MNKTRQQELTRWLKQQSIISRRWLMISRLLGVASGLLIVAQAWFLARILHRMVMENIPATALLLPLTLLVLIFGVLNVLPFDALFIGIAASLAIMAVGYLVGRNRQPLGAK